MSVDVNSFDGDFNSDEHVSVDTAYLLSQTDSTRGLKIILLSKKFSYFN